MRILPSRSILLAAAALVLPAIAHAQTARGRVLESGSNEPVSGAIVMVLDASGNRQGATLSDASGGYRVVAHAPGTYRLRVERVGFESSTSDPVTLAAGATVTVNLTANARRVVLDAVVATGAARRCAGELLNGAQAATMWDEARKALFSTTLAQESGRYHFLTETNEREVSLQGGRVMREQTWKQRTAGLPFRPVSAESLVHGSYLVMTPERVTVYGVDAYAILSDLFLKHHCFGLRDGGTERPGLVGLEFVPLADRPEPDVHGVLWIDRATAELRYVEYGYTGLTFRGPVERLSGRLNFQRLPNGLWVTESWRLVAPMLRQEGETWEMASMDRYRLWALLERSARVVSIQTLVEAPPPPQ